KVLFLERRHRTERTDMTDQNQALRDDIAFLRAIAEQGRERPMLGGPIMLAAGGLFGTASLAAWAILATGSDPRLINLRWAVSAAIYFAILVPFLRRLPKTAGAMQAATGVAWSGVGWMIFFIGLSLGVLTYRSHNTSIMYAAPSILMGLYGGAWWVAAVLMR